MLEAFALELTNDDIVSINALTLSNKQLIKLLLPYISKDECEVDEYDLEIEEVIILQLKMIDYITQNNTNQYTLILLEVDFLNEEITNILNSMDNVFVLIYAYTDFKINNIEDILFCDNLIIDFADEQQIYELICDNNIKHLTLEETKMKLRQLFTKKKNKEDIIEQLLNII